MTPKRPGTEVQGHPALDVELPVPVQEDLCRAQFNKKKRWAGSFVHSQQRPPWAGYPHPWVPTTSVRLTKIVSFSSLQQSAVSLKPQPKRQWNTAKRDVFFLTLMEVGVHVHCVSCPRKANSLSPRNFAWERTTAFLSHCEDFFFSRQLAIFFPSSAICARTCLKIVVHLSPQCHARAHFCLSHLQGSCRHHPLSKLTGMPPCRDGTPVTTRIRSFSLRPFCVSPLLTIYLRDALLSRL